MEKPQPWLIHSLHPGAVRGGSPSPTPQQLLPRSPPGSVIRRRPCAPSHAAEVPHSSTCRLTWSASTPHTRDGHVRVPGQRGRTNWETGGWGHPGWAEGTCLLARVQRDTACCSRSFQLEVQPGRRGTHTSRSTGREGAGPLLLRATASQVQRAALSVTWAWAAISSQEVAQSRLEPCRGWGGCPGRGCGWRRSASCGLRGGSEWRQKVAARTGVPLLNRNNGGLGQESSAWYLGRPRPTSAPLPLLGPERVRDALGGPFTPSTGKSRPSEEGEELRPGPVAATRLGTWNQKPARFGHPQLGGTPQTQASLPPRFVQPVGCSSMGWGAVLCTGRSPRLGLVCLQPTQPRLPLL